MLYYFQYYVGSLNSEGDMDLKVKIVIGIFEGTNFRLTIAIYVHNNREARV